MENIASQRQTKYLQAPRLAYPEVLPLPKPTDDVEQAKIDLSDSGMCFLTNVLSASEVESIGGKLLRQADAERALGDLAPPSSRASKQGLSNLVNKGAEFLGLVEREEVDELAGFVLGSSFLLSSLTGGVFNRVSPDPQQLHRDQGQVPATADFPAICNLFYVLDDFTPSRGSTCVIPGSHRWPPEYQVKPPPRGLEVQVEVPAGSIFAFDGRIWHGTGINIEGHPRKHVAVFTCLPWMRQQENWGVSCLQEILDEASPKLRARLGLRTYGTLGMISGTRVGSDERASLGNYDVDLPEFLIGEEGKLHPMIRSSREKVADR